MLKLFFNALEWLIERTRLQKRAIVFALDIGLLVISVWIAYSLRISRWIYWDETVQVLLIGATPLMIVSFVWTGMYRSIFRFAGLGMLRILVNAFIIYTAGMVLVYMVWGFVGVPRTMGLLQPITFFLLVAAARALFRVLIVDVLGRKKFGGELRRVLIYGAGVAGQQLASSLRSDPEFHVVGFVDDDLRLRGQELDGHRVYGTDRLDEALKATKASDVLLAMPGSTRTRRREIIRALANYKVRVKTLPQTRDILGDQVSISDIRPLEIDDLLGRRIYIAERIAAWQNDSRKVCPSDWCRWFYWKRIIPANHEDWG